MANRFIDTGFFKSPFVRGLKGSLKGLYCYIICDCSGAGIWAKDLEVAKIYTGFDISEKEFEQSFVNSGKAIDLKDGKFFFPDFIEHQYPKGLQINNPAQKNFISELKKYSLIDENLKVLSRPFKGSKVMVEEKVMEQEKETEKEEVEATVEIWPTFDDFWDAYGKKIDRKACEKKWDKLDQATKEKIMQHVEAYVESTPDVSFRRNPETYLNNESWNNEIVKNSSNGKQNSTRVPAEEIFAAVNKLHDKD